MSEKIQETEHSALGISWARPIKYSPSTDPSISLPLYAVHLVSAIITSHMGHCHSLPAQSGSLQSPLSIVTGVTWENIQDQVPPLLEALPWLCVS